MSRFTGLPPLNLLFPLLFLFSSIVGVAPFAEFGVGSQRTQRFGYRKTLKVSSRMTASVGNSNDHGAENDDTTSTSTSHSQKIVLIGGGHAHLQVIKALNAASRPENIHVTLVDLTDQPCYSGMVPSAVAGIYDPSETLVDLPSLAEWATIDFVKDRVVDVDVDAKVVTTQTHGPLRFDVVSVDIGSASRGLEEVPGANEYTIPTRPITELVRKIEAATQALKEDTTPTIKVVVVGAGAAGIELAMGVLGRWKPIVGESNISVTILNSFTGIFPDETPANRDSLLQRLHERGISIRNNATVRRVFPDSLSLENGDKLDFTHCLWATGAECHSQLLQNLRHNGLAVSPKGWIRVNESFQSISHPFVFAAGDCCTMELPDESPPPPKAGVYAVRAGPVLIENLTRFLQDSPTNGASNASSASSLLEKYVPQKDFLKLLACGDGKALGFRFGIPLYGKWVFQLKDAIDRSFMDLFKVEYLPTLVPGQPYDTSQYDASSDRPPPLASKEAAALLQRSDDAVDFQTAWNVLRDMASDAAYQDSVLREMAAASKQEDKTTADAAVLQES